MMSSFCWPILLCPNSDARDWRSRSARKSSLSRAVGDCDDSPLRRAGSRHRHQSPKQLASEAWKKERQERWATRINDLAWRTRLDNILHCVAKVRGEHEAKTEAWE